MPLKFNVGDTVFVKRGMYEGHIGSVDEIIPITRWKRRVNYRVIFDLDKPIHQLRRIAYYESYSLDKVSLGQEVDDLL